MSNMLSADKRKISLALRITTIGKIDKMAQAVGLSWNAIVNMILDDKTVGVILTEKEMKESNNEIEQNLTSH